MIGSVLMGLGVAGVVLPAVAQSVPDYAVRVSAVTNTKPFAIALCWLGDSQALYYDVYRKSRDATVWSHLVQLGGSVTNYVDTDTVTGIAEEYWISKTALTITADGYIYAGAGIPLVESRGKVILVVDNTFSTGLATELTRLQQDLVGDGWTVLRHDVPRMAVDPASTSSSDWLARSNELASVKALIIGDYNADPTHVTTVFLFGHVPVPYSGDIYPDGHTPQHEGAWPADTYYGDLTGSWTDSSVAVTSSNDKRNWNVPGDGKFDQVTIPSDLELQVGRVDLANLPAFSQNEQELLRQYLNKDYNFRHKQITAEPQGLIDDNFGVYGGEAYAANGWRNVAPFFGATNTISGDWLTVPASSSYLWGYGCGPGGDDYTSCSGVATTSQLAASDPPIVFTMLFGSYFGDWDSTNNLLRAALATPTYTLTCAWVARPYWYFHHMALGETIGFSTRVTQNDGGSVYNGVGFGRFVHVTLMGDPTLRMHVVAPASALIVLTNGAGGVGLSWTASPDTVLGYHVYRAPTAAGPFTRLNTDLITGTSYTDPVVTTNVYMVRAVNLEVSGSGSYYNASQGIFQSVDYPPVASNRSASTVENQSLLLPLDKLLAGASDPDGDPLTIVSTSGTSTNGGKVSLTSSNITYVPVADYFGLDLFTYTISDGRGGTVTVSVQVTVTPANAISANISSPPTMLPNGDFHVGFAGIPGFTYTIQWGPDPDGPWTYLTQIQAGSNGLFDFEDSTEGVTSRFYRCVYP